MPDKPTNNPLADRLKTLGELIKRSIQRIKTPLIETGIDLEPNSKGPQTISTAIQRTWSTIWGKYGSGLSVLRLTEHGLPIVFPIEYQLETLNYFTATGIFAAYVEISWTEDADKITLFTSDTPMELWLSTDGTSYDKITLSEDVGGQAGQHWHKAVLWGKTHKIRFKTLSAITNFGYHVIAERVKPL
jgi:hypothetical protein